MDSWHEEGNIPTWFIFKASPKSLAPLLWMSLNDRLSRTSPCYRSAKRNINNQSHESLTRLTVNAALNNSTSESGSLFEDRFNEVSVYGSEKDIGETLVPEETLLTRFILKHSTRLFTLRESMLFDERLSTLSVYRKMKKHNKISRSCSTVDLYYLIFHQCISQIFDRKTTDPVWSKI